MLLLYDNTTQVAVILTKYFFKSVMLSQTQTQQQQQHSISSSWTQLSSKPQYGIIKLTIVTQKSLLCNYYDFKFQFYINITKQIYNCANLKLSL